MLFVMGVGFLLDSPLIVFHSMCVFRLWSQCPSRCSFHMPDLCVCMAWMMSLFKCSSLLSVCTGSSVAQCDQVYVPDCVCAVFIALWCVCLCVRGPSVALCSRSIPGTVMCLSVCTGSIRGTVWSGLCVCPCVRGHPWHSVIRSMCLSVCMQYSWHCDVSVCVYGFYLWHCVIRPMCLSVCVQHPFLALWRHVPAGCSSYIIGGILLLSLLTTCFAKLTLRSGLPVS